MGKLRATMFAAVMLAACAQTERSAESPAVPQFKNLVLILIDTLRSDHLLSYGYERNTAPFLDELASGGIQVQGYSASSFTRTSVATLLTGLYPQRHQTYFATDRLPAEAPYLPSVLKGAGFHTTAYIGNPNVGEKFGFRRGYRRFVTFKGRKGAARAESRAISPERNRRRAQRWKAKKPHAEVVTDNGLKLAQQVKSPFFLQLHYLDPHAPYSPDRPWGETIAERVQPGDVKRGKVPLNERNLSIMTDLYDGAILEMDHEIARLFAQLDAAGALEDTLVVVTSDHGEEFGEHGNLQHAKTLYEEVVQVPLIFWSRQGVPSYKTDVAFHHVDLTPTLLDALGVAAPQGMDGRSRWPELVEKRLEPPAEYVFLLEYRAHAALALIAPPFKLIQQRATPRSQLYDLNADPAERRILVADEGRRLQMVSRLADRHNELSRDAFPRVTAEVDEDLQARLEALGYVQDAEPAKVRARIIPSEVHVEDGEVSFARSSPQ